MITSKVETAKIKQEEPEYPALFKSRINGIIMLFHALKCGMVMHVPEGLHAERVGYYSTTWISCTEVTVCEPFHGTITLSA